MPHVRRQFELRTRRKLGPPEDGGGCGLLHGPGEFRQAALVDDVGDQGPALPPGPPIADKKSVAQQHFKRAPHLRALALEIGVARHHHIFHMFRGVHEDHLPAQDPEGVHAAAIMILDPVSDEAVPRAKHHLKKAGLPEPRPWMGRDEIVLALFLDDVGGLVKAQKHQKFHVMKNVIIVI